MCGDLLEYEGGQVCALSLGLRLLARPYDGVVVGGYELVPCCQVVGVDLDFLDLFVVVAPRLVVVVHGHTAVF